MMAMIEGEAYNTSTKFDKMIISILRHHRLFMSRYFAWRCCGHYADGNTTAAAAAGMRHALI